MYLSTLSKTGENIIAFLLNNLGKDYSIREVAKAVDQDYKIVFTTVQHLKAEQLVVVKRVSNINSCSAQLSKENAAMFAYVSERQASKALPKKIANALHEVVQCIANPFYTLLVFGSYAKGTAKHSSDVDVLVIIHDKDQDVEFRSAIKKSATLNNLPLNPVILTLQEFQAGLKESSVSKEAYGKHLVIYGGEMFYNLIST